MNLARLDQRITLERGQARLVHVAGHVVHVAMLARDPASRRLSATELLSLEPLGKLLLRLDKLAQRDLVPLARDKRGRPRKARPHRFKLPCAQLVTVRLLYARLLATALSPEHQLVLATALGKFHQPSINLEGHIALPPPTGPGAQLNLL